MKILQALIVSFAIAVTSTAYAAEKKTEVQRAGVAVAGGAVAGAGTFAAVGSGGLAIAGTAVTIGAAPFIAAGAVVGLAGYGVYRIFADPDEAPVAKAK